MISRRLGRTGLRVSEVGLGTEHLNGQPRETVIEVFDEALAHGVNYFDVLFSFAEYRENMAAALAGHRDDVVLAGHIGCAETDGQYRRTRDADECRTLFHDLLEKLGTSWVDVLMLQFVDEEDDYAQIMGAGGLLELARELQREGKARFIGMSGHEVTVASKAVESGQIDVLMYPINLAWDSQPGRKELFQLCANRDVGLVAMKPYAGGDFFKKPDERPAALTPTHCISYVLAQAGVSTVVPGVKNPAEMRAALAYLDADSAARDYSGLISEFERDVEGHCVFCNHCLPCPVGIDVARTLRLVSIAELGITDILQAEYADLPAPASDCIACGDCMERCPFSVDVIAQMEQAAEYFE